jgi:hypothetical protein
MFGTFASCLQRLRGQSPAALARRAAARLTRVAPAAVELAGFYLRSPYRPWAGAPGDTLARIFPTPDLEVLRRHEEDVRLAAECYLEHRFDLLGSGWVRVFRGMAARGFEGVCFAAEPAVDDPRDLSWIGALVNRRSAVNSKRIWSLIAAPDYLPIDWQIDFKSGYRWRDSTPSLSVPYRHELGVDLKVPWELARMQHLPVLAWAHALSGGGSRGFRPPAAYAGEFRSQILDFIATNPPGWGVNWRCTMDVGIRVANWLVAYDLFRANGTAFDGEFERVVRDSVFQHAGFIARNLEYSPGLRSNHYYADVVGLLYAAAYLPRAAVTDAWLAFAVQEIVAETLSQFHEDGTNFEASTGYHRLTTEMAAFAGLLIVALPEDKRRALAEYVHDGKRAGMERLKPVASQSFLPLSAAVLPEAFWHRLERAIEFTRDLTKPDGLVAQIGDNDSGRFLKLMPIFRRLPTRDIPHRYRHLKGFAEELPGGVFLDEEILDHRHLVALGRGMFARDDWNREAKLCPVEHAFARAIAERKAGGSLTRLAPDARNMARQRKIEDSAPGAPVGAAAELLHCLVQRPALTRAVQTFAYPEFGVFGWRSDKFFLAIRCGSIGQNGNGGHAHNDQFLVELQVEGVDVLRDPGTYVYTPHPDLRRRFRSARSHPVAWPKEDGEQNDISAMFRMRQTWTPRVCSFDVDHFRAELRNDAGEARLICVLVKADRVEINRIPDAVPFFSNGYGKLLNLASPC